MPVPFQCLTDILLSSFFSATKAKNLSASYSAIHFCSVHKGSFFFLMCILMPEIPLLFLCLHWCCSGSHCYQLQISLTYCLYSLFQVINNKDIKSGSTYLPLNISPGTCSQLFDAAACNSSVHMTAQSKSTGIFSYQHL